ncbi:MAG: beta-galactosidase [Lachnospiraceae bacterium]|nr:beta-galactosidase [Lachnospiraceae bacterium]
MRHETHLWEAGCFINEYDKENVKMDDFFNNTVLFGGDYNPDQWDPETIKKDMELFKEANINVLTLPVFSWTKLEPSEGNYTFEWLDEILDIIEENGFRFFLATPTAAQPAWMSLKYPEVHLVDDQGRRKVFGSRTLFCLNSEKYRERAGLIAERFASHFGKRKGLLGWHVANEYGHYCYCDACRKKFAGWLKNRYGSIEELNRRLNTAFWNRTYTSFEEITVPSGLNDENVCDPALMLSYQRFMTDSTLECFDNEARILKKATPKLPVFTNISSNLKALDLNKMAESMDTVGWDNYPDPGAPASYTAMTHDIMRGLKDGRSFYVMEQSPNQQNWQPYNKVKRPGEIRELAYQGLAHGADSSMYFQMRQSVSGVEKFHGALISHSGRNDTRVFREMKQLGGELKSLGTGIVGAQTRSETGIIMDWNSWWALENSSGPSESLDYLKELHKYYSALHKRNISVDFLKPCSDLSGYKAVFTPLLYMITKETAEKLEKYVKNGGTLIATYLTGYADEDDRCVYGAYPGPLRRVLGLWVEETDALFPDERNRICISSELYENQGFKREYFCDFLCDRIRIEGAEPLGFYGKDFYSGEPCFCVNRSGKGKAYYLASRPEEAFLDDFIHMILKDCGIAAPFLSEGEVEISLRTKNGEKTWFIICHDRDGGSVDLSGNSGALDSDEGMSDISGAKTHFNRGGSTCPSGENEGSAGFLSESGEGAADGLSEPRRLPVYEDILTGRLIQGKVRLKEREVLVLREC